MTDAQLIKIGEEHTGGRFTRTRVSPNGAVWFLFGGGIWIREDRLQQWLAAEQIADLVFS